jgi:hypothetical protein
MTKNPYKVVPVYGGSTGMAPLTLDFVTGWTADLLPVEDNPVPIE